jgi:hypothetical protein
VTLEVKNFSIPENVEAGDLMKLILSGEIKSIFQVGFEETSLWDVG